MKALKLIVIAIVLFLSNTAVAQVSVNINFGPPPMWGPVGYTDVRYYYLPDVEAYYDIQTSMFIYYGGGVWVHRAYLPSRYRDYDLYSGYKVVMTDYRGDAPYANFHHHKAQYARGYRGEPQRSIGNRPSHGNSRGNVRPAQQPRGNPGHGNGNNQGGGHEKNRNQGHGGGKGHK